jgi:hypothetical protein
MLFQEQFPTLKAIGWNHAGLERRASQSKITGCKHRHGKCSFKSNFPRSKRLVGTMLGWNGEQTSRRSLIFFFKIVNTFNRHHLTHDNSKTQPLAKTQPLVKGHTRQLPIICPLNSRRVCRWRFQE